MNIGAIIRHSAQPIAKNRSDFIVADDKHSCQKKPRRLISIPQFERRKCVIIIPTNRVSNSTFSGKTLRCAPLQKTGELPAGKVGWWSLYVQKQA